MMARPVLAAYRAKVQAVFQDPYSSLNPRLRIRTIIAGPLRAHAEELRSDELDRLGALDPDQRELLDAHPRIGADPSSVSALSFREQGYDREAADRAAEQAAALLPASTVVGAFHNVAAAALNAPTAFGIGTPGAIHGQSLIEMSLGVAIGAVVFRVRSLRGELFALLTLAVTFVLATIALNTPIDGGPGVFLSGVTVPSPYASSASTLYLLALLLAALALWTAWALQRSRIGRAFARYRIGGGFTQHARTAVRHLLSDGGECIHISTR